MIPYYKLSIDNCIKQLDSNKESGLTTKEANIRLKKYDRNITANISTVSPIKIILHQIIDPMILIMLGIALISFLIPSIEYGYFVAKINTTTILIIFVLFINIIISSIQDYNTSKEASLLKQKTDFCVKIIRDGENKIIQSSNLTPGDIVILHPGDKVPADIRVISSIKCYAQESILTGESSPVAKNENIINKDVILTKRSNILFSDTIVIQGRITGIVIATGNNTAIGKMIKIIRSTDQENTPLQTNISNLNSWLCFEVIILCAMIFLIWIAINGIQNIHEILTISLSLSIAAIPEGLIAIVTTCLIIGAKTMLKRNTLVKKMKSIEVMRCIDTICIDKTGTLTTNEIEVKHIFINNKMINLDEQFEIKNLKQNDNKVLEKILEIGIICNDATITKKSLKFGDPTEISLLKSGNLLKINRNSINKKYVRINEMPFNSDRRMMSTYNVTSDNRKNIFAKGAVETILEKCSQILIDGTIRIINEQDKKNIFDIYNKFSNKGYRILGFAYDENKTYEEKSLIFVGMQIMQNVFRDNAKYVIQKIQQANIRLILMTGDNINATKSTARQLGIDDTKVCTGQEIEKYISESNNILNEVSIFAKMDPNHKLKMINYLKNNNHKVAMIGDGINDAMSLKSANIGISVGDGADIAKETSDIILLDNNLLRIIELINEAHIVFKKIKKSVLYLLSSNISEVLIIVLSVIIKLPLPLIATQLLWINCITDTFPAIGLSIESSDKDNNILYDKNISNNAKIISNKGIAWMTFFGAMIAIISLLLFIYYNHTTNDIKYARTIAFTSIVVLQIFHILNCYFDDKKFNIAILLQKKIILTIIIVSIILQVVIIYLPLSQNIFNTCAINVYDWFIILTTSTLIIIINELYKIISKNRK